MAQRLKSRSRYGRFLRTKYFKPKTINTEKFFNTYVRPEVRKHGAYNSIYMAGQHNRNHPGTAVHPNEVNRYEKTCKNKLKCGQIACDRFLIDECIADLKKEEDIDRRIKALYNFGLRKRRRRSRK